MPSRSPDQYKFMYKVYGVQKGLIPPHTVGASVRKAAKKMHPSSVKDFLTKSPENLDDDIRYEIISVLKEIREPMYLEEQEQTVNPVAKTFTKKGDFEQTVNSFKGVQFDDKEMQAIHNYMETKPSELDRFHISYDTTDSFGNNTTTVVKKLIEKNASGGNNNGQPQTVYTAFTKYSNVNKDQEGNEQPPMQEQESLPPSASPGQDEIIITKSAPFVDAVQGSEIIGNFLKKLDL